MNARIAPLAAAVLVNCSLALAQDKPERDIRQSVVRVFATVRLPDMLEPWNKQQPQQAAGSGVVIDGERILTNLAFRS